MTLTSLSRRKVSLTSNFSESLIGSTPIDIFIAIFALIPPFLRIMEGRDLVSFLEMCESGRKRRREKEKKGLEDAKIVIARDRRSHKNHRNESNLALFIFLLQDVPSWIANRPRKRRKQNERNRPTPRKSIPTSKV